MTMTAVNYSALMREENASAENSWENIYDFDLDLPQNLLSILSASVFLPCDHYDIIAAYYLVPSALCRILPYLFLYGISGSGKSTLTKIPQYLHGVKSDSSSDTYAGIRNSLNARKYKNCHISNPDPSVPDVWFDTEVNTMMIWDDVDPRVFGEKPDLYRLFKFGYDRATDKIEVSSITTGQNEVFHCFCPKVLSSIHPLHTDPSFKELHRRMLVIPTQKIEEIPDDRRTELGIVGNNWIDNILDIDTIAWKGFNQTFDDYWDEARSREFLLLRKEVAKKVRGLSSLQRAICLDLITCGVACGIWKTISEATDRFIDYFEWLEGDKKIYGDALTQLIEQFIEQEEVNAKAVGTEVEFHSKIILSMVDAWTSQGMLLEKPRPKEVRAVLNELGYRQSLGIWKKT
jgi:hypothetical protein